MKTLSYPCTEAEANSFIESTRAQLVGQYAQGTTSTGKHVSGMVTDVSECIAPQHGWIRVIILNLGAYTPVDLSTVEVIKMIANQPGKSFTCP